MIYIIPMIITLIILSVMFREEFSDDAYEYLIMVFSGALIWPITVVWMIWVYFDWRRE